MKNLIKPKNIIVIILALVFVSLVIISSQDDSGFIEAGIEHNVSGYAWSENVGWVSFNSESGGGNNYGVHIDPATGDLSGYAWSENIGWISFNRTETYNPPINPYKNGSGAIAKYDTETGELTGWMRVLSVCDSVPCPDPNPGTNSGGWDGWIRFCDDSMANCSLANQIAEVDSSGDWHGWAWSDMVIGWLNFNSAEGGGGISYKVISPDAVNQAPTITDIGVTPSGPAVCCGETPAHYFSWIHNDSDSGDTQSQFQFQVDNNSDFSSPEVDRLYSGLSSPAPTSNNQNVVLVVEPAADQLGYNTPYYWRVMTWDQDSRDSGWVQYNDPSDADGDGDPLTFTTAVHRYPSVDFSWNPTNPNQGEDVVFSDESVCYDVSNDPIACASWNWTFTNASPTASIEQNPIIQFDDIESTAVLETTDNDGFICSETKNIDIDLALPGWKEVLPED